MKKYIVILIFNFIACFSDSALAQDTLSKVTDTLMFSGQLSAWGHYNHNNVLPVSLGGRYIPTLHYDIDFPKEKTMDFEGSLNAYGDLSCRPFDSLHPDAGMDPYRFWIRFSTPQLEVRAGLQKISFGSATLLRPLMWFDQADPRDPLKIANGVWGLLGRYYFLNNTNVWLWCLVGNNKLRPWDTGKTTKDLPELGGRYQRPIPKGELGITYHFREADTRNLGPLIPAYSEIPEHRIGLDAKWDLGPGLWFESAWIQKEKNMGNLTNQEIFNLGTDYTFKAGNGLHVLFEQLLISTDEYAFTFSNNWLFSGLSLSYPAVISDNLYAIVYYDWKNRHSYNFINWNHTFKNLTLYLMAYLNPDQNLLPQQGYGNLYSGPGFQMMLVYNH